MKKKRKLFIPLKSGDDPRAAEAVAHQVGGKIQKVRDTGTGKVFKAIVYDER